MSRVSYDAAAQTLIAAGVILLAIGTALGIAAAGERTLPVEIEIMQAVQGPAWAGFDLLAWAASRAGDVLPAMILIATVTAALCWVRGRPDLALFILAATALRAVGPPLKWLYASPRPPADAVSIFELADGYGYPSGHAYGAALLFGALAVALSRIAPDPRSGRVLQGVAVAMIVLVGFSRIRLGVHWPSDVIGGLAFGLGFLCLLLAALRCFTVQNPGFRR